MCQEPCVAMLLVLCEIYLVNLGNIAECLRILGRDSKEAPLRCSAKALPLDRPPLVTHCTSKSLSDCWHGVTFQNN